MAKNEYDFLFKILIFGESDEQKNEFLSKFFDDSSRLKHLTTIGIDQRIKILDFENKKIKLQLHNSLGQCRFRNIIKENVIGAHGIILIYDVTDQSSFEKIKTWIEQISQNKDESTRTILVGDKCDSPDRVITEEEGKKLAEEFNFGFLETSSTNNKNINEVFYYLVKDNPNIKKVEQINHDSKKCIII